MPRSLSPLSSCSRPVRPSSRSSASRPRAMFSSRRCLRNQLRILFLVELVATKLSQSSDGWPCLVVRISTMSPFLRWWSSVTIRPLTLAPMQRLPTSVWTR
ncbi:hypothetical protein D3C86_1112110 [compost metagenome]